MNPDRPIYVVVADDFVEAQDGLRHIISKAVDMEVVGVAETLGRVIQLVRDTQPDVIVLDIAWPSDDEAGLKIVPQLRRVSPESQIVAITAYPELFSLAKRAGLRALKKGFSREELLDAIRWARQQTDAAVAVASASELPDLTSRERDVLSLLAEGLTDKEIAQRLHLAPGTIKKHVSSILSKLDVGNRTEAAVKAQQFI